MTDTANAAGSEDGRRGDPMDAHLDSAEQRVAFRQFPQVIASAVRLTWEASPRGFLTAACFQIFGAVMVGALVVVGKWALSAILAAGHGTGGPGTLVPVVILLAVVTAAGSAAAVLQQQQQRLLGEEVSLAAHRRVLNVTGRVGLEFYESSRFYDQLLRVKNNAVVQPLAVTSSVFGLIGSAVSTVGLAVILTYIAPLLVPILLLAGIPRLLLSRRASRAEFQFVKSATPLYRSREYLRAVLTGRDEAKEVRAFGAEHALRTRHDARSMDFLVMLRKHVRVRQGYAFAGVAASTIALVLALGLLVWLVALHRLSLADAGAAALGVRLLSGNLDGIFQSVGNLFQSSVFLTDLERFLDLTVVTEKLGCGVAPSFRREIVVRQASYTYPGSAEPAVRGVSLRIGAGEVVAIVGENGSGKTTLAKLIAGLYPPTEGAISWDDVDIATLEPADVRRGVAVIFQDFVRYQLTALENIGLGDPDRVDDERHARAAAQQAGAAEFLERLPHGYATILSKEYEGGFDLSVGQWQRVALARALRRAAPLVILDEPSAALDPRAEHKLFADVRATLHGRSALLISHRYSTVRSADRIYVMRGGRIIEAGSHESLMNDGGLYAELFSLQARAYQ